MAFAVSSWNMKFGKSIGFSISSKAWIALEMAVGLVGMLDGFAGTFSSCHKAWFGFYLNTKLF